LRRKAGCLIVNNCIFATNSNCAIKVDISNRRYFVLDCNNKYTDDEVYFDRLVGQLKTKEAAVHFFHWLANRDLKSWRPKKIPETTLKKQLKMNTIPAPIEMLMEIYTGEYEGFP